jgi:hypothetical protein
MRNTFIALPLLLAACATKGEMRNLPSDAGTKDSYSAGWDKIRLAAQDTCAELGFEIKPKETLALETEVRLLASQGLSSGTGGRYLRVRLVKGEGAEVAVYVAIRSKVDSSDARKVDDLMEKDFQKKLAARLSAK